MTIERPYNGYYARVDGGDGVGKTTLMEKSREFAEANGIDVVFVREPGGTQTGLQIRQILLHSIDDSLSPAAEAALFVADRKITADNMTLPHLQKGGLVLGDRGVESGACYQAAAGGMEMSDYLALNNLIMDDWYMWPDALVILDLPEEEIQKRFLGRLGRGGFVADNIERRHADYQRRVREMYSIIARERNATIINDPSLNPDEVFEIAKPHLFGPFLREL